MIRTFSFLTIILFGLTVWADNDKAKEKIENNLLSGKIVDHLTGENLAGVKIQVLNSEITAYTDLDGNFELSVPVNNSGKHIQISYISYETTIISMENMSNQGEIKILPVAR